MKIRETAKGNINITMTLDQFLIVKRILDNTNRTKLNEMGLTGDNRFIEVLNMHDGMNDFLGDSFCENDDEVEDK